MLFRLFKYLFSFQRYFFEYANLPSDNVIHNQIVSKYEEIYLSQFESEMLHSSQ